MMDWWAIIMLVIPLVVLCVARIIIEFTPIIVVENNIIKKIIMTISELLLLPIMLIYFVALFIPSMWSVNKKTFKKLIDKGFTYKYKNKVYTLKRENIEIQILANLEDYYISFDNGENFVRIEESNLGFQYDRDELKFRLHEYITAPSLYTNIHRFAGPFNSEVPTTLLVIACMYLLVRAGVIIVKYLPSRA